MFRSEHISNCSPRSQSASRLARIVLSSGLLLAFAASAFLSFQVGGMSGAQSAHTSIIASSWSEGTKYPVWYGAIVWTEWNAMGTIDVYADIMIGKPPDSAPMRHNVGLLATEPTPETTIKNWGQVVWTDADVTFGAGGPKPVVITRDVIQRHR
jgi:hypothetical protein